GGGRGRRPRGRAGGGRPQRHPRAVLPDGPVAAALLQPADARAAGRLLALRAPGGAAGAAAALAPAAPVDVLGGAHPPRRPPAQFQERPHRHALVGGDALPLPRRGGVRLPGAAAPALEAARAEREVPAAPGGRALAAALGGLAAQADVLVALRRLLRRAGAAVRGRVAERGVAAADGLLRAAGGALVVEGAAAGAARLGPAHAGGHGPGRRPGHAAVAPHLPRRRPRRPALPGARGRRRRKGGG